MEFKYSRTYQYTKKDIEYEKVPGSESFVQTLEVDGRQILKVDPKALEWVSFLAIHEISYFFRKTHLENFQKILLDPEASSNDKYVALKLIENAVEASKGILPSCQDTGTAIALCYKGQNVWTDADDKEYISKGIFKTYTEENLRYSQMAPLSMFEEKNTGTNLPAQIDIYSTTGSQYELMFIAKGGGSANKTKLYQKTKNLLTEENLYNFLAEEIKAIGTSACPPYYLAIVIGGTSAEENLKMVKYASTESMDNLVTSGDESGRAYRDLVWEEKVMEIARKTGMGAQFGGKYFAHKAVVIRLPRHGASCPVGIGVSCSAHRNILTKINKEGIFLEKLEKNPEKYLPKTTHSEKEQILKIDLNKSMEETRSTLSKYPVGTKILLTGTLIVARDIAHAKIDGLIKSGKPMPEYFKKYPVYYAGPSKTPSGMPTGSFGPTTSNRMDVYLDTFMSLGASFVTIGKGERTKVAVEAFKKHKGFYMGSIGGIAATLTKESIESMELVDFGELGMEAIRKIEVRDFPVVIVIDDKGNSLFS